MKSFICLLFLPLLSLAAPRQIELSPMNTASIDGEITPMEMTKDMSEILLKRAFMQPEQILYVIVVSSGGETEVGRAILRQLSILPNVQLICKYCGSSAAFIFSAFPGKRLLTKKSALIFHHMYSAHFTAKDARNLNHMTSFIKESDDFDETIYSALKMKKEDYLNKIDDKDWELDFTEALKFHAGDELVELKCDPRVALLYPNTCSQ